MQFFQNIFVFKWSRTNVKSVKNSVYLMVVTLSCEGFLFQKFHCFLWKFKFLSAYFQLFHWWLWYLWVSISTNSLFSLRVFVCLFSIVSQVTLIFMGVYFNIFTAFSESFCLPLFNCSTGDSEILMLPIFKCFMTL